VPQRPTAGDATVHTCESVCESIFSTISGMSGRISLKHIMSTATDDIFKVMDSKVTEMFSVDCYSSPLKTI